MSYYDPPRRRTGDQSDVMRLLDFARRWAILWVPAAWLATSLGYGLITPRLTAAQVQNRAEEGDRRLQAEIDSVKSDHIELARQLEGIVRNMGAVVRLDCLDPKISRDLKIAAALPCNN